MHRILIHESAPVSAIMSDGTITPREFKIGEHLYLITAITARRDGMHNGQHYRYFEVVAEGKTFTLRYHIENIHWMVKEGGLA